ncbi:MAG: zinc ABC transporter substrate-binding protein [Heliobacteriaceae bacterium]|nr:zinc ABC transporter substrate-binding protein [Heliobacteriaceae bacterium]
MRELFKFSLVGLIIVGFLGLNGCAGYPDRVETVKQARDVTIVTSFYPLYIMTLNITKEIPGVNVINLGSPQTGCLHDYQLTPGDMKALEKARILVVNGAGMEPYLDIVHQRRPDLPVIDASQQIRLLKNMDGSEENPHVSVSITGAIQQVKNIGEQLQALDPQFREQYKANTAQYVQSLEALRQKMQQDLEPLPNRNIVTFHQAFTYFAEEFGFEIVAVVEQEAGVEPSATELADTIKLVQNYRVKALFGEPQYSTKVLDAIARETGAKVYVLDPAVTGPNEPDAYIRIMEKNLQVLQEALQ